MNNIIITEVQKVLTRNNKKFLNENIRFFIYLEEVLKKIRRKY